MTADRSTAHRARPGDEIDWTIRRSPASRSRRADPGAASSAAASARSRSSPSLLVLLVVFRDPIAGAISSPRLQTWTTVFVSVMVQAVPFLVFGVALSAVIAVFVPRSFWARALPRHPALAVPVASCAGVVLPGCECGVGADRRAR